MAQKLNKTQQEQTLVRAQRQELKHELAEQYAQRSRNVTYPLLFDPVGAVNQQYNVTAIPTTYFIDSNGFVRSVFVQPLTPETMKQGLASVGVSFS